MDCGGAADRCHFALPRSRDSAAATATRRSSAAAARHALAGICVGLLMRHPVVCRNLLLDLRHHAPLWWPADSSRDAGAGFVLYVRGALPRDVRAVAGFGRRIIRGSRVDLVGAPGACGGSVSLGCRGTGSNTDYGVSVGASGIFADREFCAHANCHAHRRVWAFV